MTRNYSLNCFAYRLIPVVAILGTSLTLMDVVADGFSLCMIMSDLLVARVSGESIAEQRADEVAL